MSANGPLLVGDEPLDVFLRTQRKRGRLVKAAKPAKPPRASERAIQMAIIDALRFSGVMAVHVPNAGKRSGRAGVRLKGEGMRPGFPDLVCYGPGGAHALLEVKAEAGRLSPAQVECHEDLRRRGALVLVVRSVDEARDGLRAAGWYA